MGAAIVTNGSATLWPFRDDTFPSRNAISKAPRAAAIAVAISSIGEGHDAPIWPTAAEHTMSTLGPTTANKMLTPYPANF